MSWHGFAAAIAPPLLTQETYSAVARVLDHRELLGNSALSALDAGRWVTMRCDHVVSGRRCNTYLGEAFVYGSAQVAVRCQRPRCKDSRTLLFVGGVPETERDALLSGL